jgi:hypothetical protein
MFPLRFPRERSIDFRVTRAPATVLLVDDREANRFALEALLEPL